MSSEAGTEGVSWECDMLGEVWAFVAASRVEGGIDLDGQHVMVMCVSVLDQF